VIQTELTGVDRGIISCDRYSGYKRFARLNPKVVLAYCWAHQRRDFLDLANSYPDLLPWAFEWVQAIGELHHLNGLRLRLAVGSEARTAAHCTLVQAVKKMADACAACVINPELSPPAAKVLESMTGSGAHHGWIFSVFPNENAWWRWPTPSAMRCKPTTVQTPANLGLQSVASAMPRCCPLHTLLARKDPLRFRRSPQQSYDQKPS